MTGKVDKYGMFRDLIIHPGETVEDVLEERGITQEELAMQTGESVEYVRKLIEGKENISEVFAVALEGVLGVPESFWVNLQGNYDEELLGFTEGQMIAKEEIISG